MQYSYFPYSWHHCTYNSTSSDAITVTLLTVGITVPTTALALMQYSYLPYSWHHCTYNSTSCDAVPVTSLTVGITVSTTALALMQYRLLPLQLASLYLQQH